MRRSLLSGLAFACVCLVLAEVAMACSENVFRPGQGMAYRKLATANPARVVIDADPASEGFSSERAADLQQGLSETGHTVAVTTNARKLAETLAAGPFDVVLTSVDQAAALASATSPKKPAPVGLPVVRGGVVSGLRQRFPHALSADASLRQVLKAIERTMESRVQ